MLNLRQCNKRKLGFACTSIGRRYWEKIRVTEGICFSTGPSVMQVNYREFSGVAAKNNCEFVLPFTAKPGDWCLPHTSLIFCHVWEFNEAELGAPLQGVSSGLLVLTRGWMFVGNTFDCKQQHRMSWWADEWAAKGACNKLKMPNHISDKSLEN